MIVHSTFTDFPSSSFTIISNVPSALLEPTFQVQVTIPFSSLNFSSKSFDFEGPVVEIVTAVVAGVSFIGKKVSQYKLDEFSRESTEIIDSNDKDTLVAIAENIGSVVSSRNR